MENTSSMKMTTGDPGMPQLSGLSFSPAEIHANRFLLYAISFLLCTPSDFSEVVEGGGDADMWLKNAGIDPDQPCSRTRDMCVEYVNKIRRHPTAYLSMCSLHHSLPTVMLSVFAPYAPIACPNLLDAKAIVNCMVQLGHQNATRSHRNDTHS